MAPTNTGKPVANAPWRLLSHEQWQQQRAAHHAAVDALTAAHLQRRRHGTPHPIIDFLFTYYRSSVGQLRTWNPGPGIALAVPTTPTQLPRFYQHVRVDGHDAIAVDTAAVRVAKGHRWQRAATIVAATAARPGRMTCFGLHEWAMVYRLKPSEIRHAYVPLRLSPAEIAAQVEGGVRCTHFDAFRFFTPDAEPLNDARLSRAEQAAHEQPACLHAGMDLYRWASELGPLCPADLLLDTFTAAVDARIIDMRAAPYDLREYGYPPIAVETAAGRAEYASYQRQWVSRTNRLRMRLLEVYRTVDVIP